MLMLVFHVEFRMVPTTDYSPDFDDKPWYRANTCPDECLCHAPSRSDIKDQIENHRTDTEMFYRHAVYVLECRRIDPECAIRRAITELEIQYPRWTESAAAEERRFYVGVSKRVYIRIYNHAMGTGRASNFCRIFPPARILTIEWHPTLAESYRAEERMAERLRNHFTNAYVAQPG